MGNINTANSQSQLPINFKELKQQKHSILGDLKHILNTHDDSQYILIERVFASSMQFQKCLKNVKNRCKLAKMKHKYLPNQFIMQIIDYRTAQYSEFCGKTFKIFIFIKSFDSDLKCMFKQRQQAGQKFTENQLLQLMLKIVNCLIELYDHNIKPFHLSMESIICRNNKFKIIDRQLTNQMSPIDSLNYRSQLKSGTFIAPQMLSQNYEYSTNTSKSDIFTFGILILEISHLKPLDQLYDYNERKINFVKIEQLISKLNYSQNFKLILNQMLEQFPQQRIGILRLKQNLSQIDKFLINEKNTNILEDSGQKPLSSNKGLIYLGKHPNSIKNQNIQKSTASTRPTHGRKNSYHRLLNEKADQRNKKSISFNEGFTHHSSQVVNNYRKTSVPRTSFRQIPQKNIQIIPQPLQINQNHIQDFEDNRSDVPISPVSLHKKQNNYQAYLGNIDGINNTQPILRSKPLYQQNKRINNEIEENQKYQHLINNGFSDNNQTNKFQCKNFNKKITQQLNSLNQIHKTYQNFQFQAWIEKQKGKLKQNEFNFDKKPDDKSLNSYNQPYPGADFKISQFPSFSLPSKPSIQQLETPRIAKYKEIYQFDSKMKTKSFERNQLPEETPIKSLELIQSQRRQNKNHFNTSNTKNQKEKTFGRYDFSNGSVYQGQFNSDNQFQGNGVLYFSSGKIFYSGCWKKNQFHGFGILNNIENQKQPSNKNIKINYKDFNLNDNNLWTQYEGEFFQDKKHGFGTLYFVNGDKFSGCFVNDSIQGFGNFFQKDSSRTIMGIWTNNIYREP